MCKRYIGAIFEPLGVKKGRDPLVKPRDLDGFEFSML